MAAEFAFTEEDMMVDDGVGYPKAYAKLCRDRGAGPYCYAPPFTFTPYSLQQNEKLRARELEQLFPVIDPKAKKTGKPKIFASLLWKQLSHLGNAGFDPAVIRVDTYGNVLYLHADKASPLAWDIDHWFPCQRGGLTVPSNLRILQWQVCKRKHTKLEFLVPWWDFQLGISVNQFISIFASSNSDFRHRAFSFLFAEAENEEINDSQTVDSHLFPQHFFESKEQIGLAPAALVVSRRESYDSSMALKSLDYNRQIRAGSPAIAARKVRHSDLKENENPDFVTNPYQAIVLARDSLKQREESQKIQTEIQKLDDEVHEMRRKNDEEKLAIQDLEMQLIKRRRRAEKCRRLAEAQSSYRAMLEKMIRDAMHQSVIYKEQARLNQAATSALMARLEAQKTMCDNSERELHKKFKQRDEIERQIRPEWEYARKRSRMDDTLSEDRDHKAVLYLPGTRPRTPLHKELRVFLEEEHKASDAGMSANEDGKYEEIEELKNPATDIIRADLDGHNESIIVVSDNEFLIEHKLRALNIGEGKRDQIQFPIIRESELEEDEEDEKRGEQLAEGKRERIQFPIIREPEIKEDEEDEEGRKQRGKGNVERWLQLLLDNSQDDVEPENSNDLDKSRRSDDIIARLNQKFPQKEAKKKGYDNKEALTEERQQITHEKDKGNTVEEVVEIASNSLIGKRNVGGGEGKERTENGKGKGLARSESARSLRQIPSSPLLLGMRKGVECMRKKPMVTDEDDNYCYESHAAAGNSFIKSSMKSIKKAVKI
ncbi:uncharacterized protein [Euphorbia lathyris]|uniref:uncharacterized protein n=1 Tax=Euphorbia lathyris TaxID=212925 RepID=UPI003313A86D